MEMHDSVLIDFAAQCKVQAALLGDYKSLTVEQLADGYISASEAKDEDLRNQYMSALLLRFWFTIKNLYNSTKSAVGTTYSQEDFITTVYNRIEYACKYRAWRDVDKKLNATQCINRAISTEVKNIFYRSNLDIHKANINSISLDTPFDSGGIDSDVFEDTIIDEDSYDKQSKSDLAARSYIQSFVNKDKLVEAIILDTIAFNNADRVDKVRKKAVDSEGKEYGYTEVYSSFWKARAIKYLNTLPKWYAKYFKANYEVREDLLDVALQAIRSASGQKLNRYMTNTLKEAKLTAKVLCS